MALGELTRSVSSLTRMATRTTYSSWFEASANDDVFPRVEWNNDSVGICPLSHTGTQSPSLFSSPKHEGAPDYFPQALLLALEMLQKRVLLTSTNFCHCSTKAGISKCPIVFNKYITCTFSVFHPRLNIYVFMRLNGNTYLTQAWRSKGNSTTSCMPPGILEK